MIRMWLQRSSYSSYLLYPFTSPLYAVEYNSDDSIDLSRVFWFDRVANESPNGIKIGKDFLDRGYKI